MIKESKKRIALAIHELEVFIMSSQDDGDVNTRQLPSRVMLVIIARVAAFKFSNTLNNQLQHKTETFVQQHQETDSTLDTC
jgi:hypothetical protein